MAKVYHFRVWDQNAGDMIVQRFKSTRERIATLPTAEIMEETEEDVPDEALDDEGRWDGQTKLLVLPPGQRAPENADYIRIDRLPSGKFNVSGSVAFDRGIIVGDGRCDEFAEAKLAGLFWAQERGAKLVYVETDHATWSGQG